MYSICCSIVPEGKLSQELEAMAAAEKGFTPGIGVLERGFYQCLEQPHVIWARTRWTREAAHNAAAAGIMKVRRDDRVAAAYFEPGLYFETFCEELVGAAVVDRELRGRRWSTAGRHGRPSAMRPGPRRGWWW